LLTTAPHRQCPERCNRSRARRRNRVLERRVDERTRELRASNEELESFASTVAHDLRSPLRSMDGFADAIERDETSVLSDASRTYLARIRAAAQRLSVLIDDVLKLSRVARAALVRQRVDLSGLARGIVAELQARDPERRVQVEVAEGLVADGDPVLLRIALENLLNNAWKFTQRTAEARISFRRVGARGGRAAFVVEDNGVGFDMDYASQLFTPFQRLHKRTEFEGTGIGLATVKRIVTRHGGEVWAEASLERGASVYFTLG
jgi:signal transduction histidine kinase